jgi:biotin operon repressor
MSECTPSAPCRIEGCPFCDPVGYLDQARPESAVDDVNADISDRAKPDGEDLLARLESLLLDTDGLDTIADPEPLIHNDILFTDSINWLVGKPGHGKSFVMIDQAGCVATGTDWHGNPVTMGRVLYLVAEGARGIKKRVRAWERAYGVKMTGVDFLPVPVQATNRTAWATLVALAAKRRYAMVILDTQARVTVGIEENSNKEMGEFVHQAEKLREAAGACVVIVHHIGRNGDTGRGATTLDGALTTIMKASKDGSAITLECQKQKDAEEWGKIEFELIPSGESAVLRSMTRISANLVSGPSSAASKTAGEWFALHGEEWMSATRLIDTLGITSTTFYRHKEELRKGGVIEAREAGKGYQYRHLGAPGGSHVPTSHP